MRNDSIITHILRNMLICAGTLAIASVVSERLTGTSAFEQSDGMVLFCVALATGTLCGLFCTTPGK